MRMHAHQALACAHACMCACTHAHTHGALHHTDRSQAQRICFARALLRAKPLLLLDEPVSSQDATMVNEFSTAIAKLKYNDFGGEERAVTSLLRPLPRGYCFQYLCVCVRGGGEGGGQGFGCEGLVIMSSGLVFAV